MTDGATPARRMRWLAIGSLRFRIAVPLLLPVLGLLALSATILADKLATVAAMQRVGALTELVTETSALVHEVQRERGASNGFLASKGTQLATELPEQRNRTDARLAGFLSKLEQVDRASPGGPLADKFAAARDSFLRLSDIREQISRLALKTDDSFAFFTAANTRLLDMVGRAAVDVEVPEIARSLSIYLSFLQAKELAGQERAVGAAGFAAGRFEPGRLRRFLTLGDQQDLYFSIIASSAIPSQTAFMQQTLAGDATDAVLRVRRIAAESSLDGNLHDVTGAEWFKVATVRIELLKQIEDRLATDLKSLSTAVGEAAQQELYTTAVAIFVLLVLTGAIGAVMIRAIVRPLGSHIRTMERLAVGETELVIAGADRRDELGSMARAIGTFRDQAVENKQLAAAQKIERARAEADKGTALQNMADMIESETTKALAEVSNRTTAMTKTADSMSSSAIRTGHSAQSAAGAASQTLANAQAVASAAEQLSSSIREISAQMLYSTALVSQAVSAGEETRSTIDQLNGKVAAIGSVAGMIREIAGRTNLLALNATIEAARAGEAGKGFAVVAGEVKALAMQTARSTEEISRHLAEVRTATAASVDAVFRIGTTISQIDQVASSIAAAVEEQGAATAEIARNVAQTAQAADEMTTRVAEVSTEADENGHNAGLVHNAATGLATAVSDLKHTVMRVVRNSTTDVDRRLTQRHEVNLTGHLSVSGGSGRACRITEMSELGARVDGAPGIAVGSRGTLKVDGFDGVISWCVRNQYGDELGVSFDHDASTTAGVTAILQRVTRQAA